MKFLFILTPIINWLEQSQKPCLIKKHMGFECPGCGMQTAFIELLKGNLSESVKAYPALMPIIILFILLTIQIIFKLKNGSVILKYWFIFTVAITFVSYFLKFI